MFIKSKESCLIKSALLLEITKLLLGNFISTYKILNCTWYCFIFYFLNICEMCYQDYKMWVMGGVCSDENTGCVSWRFSQWRSKAQFSWSLDTGVSKLNSNNSTTNLVQILYHVNTFNPFYEYWINFQISYQSKVMSDKM